MQDKVYFPGLNGLRFLAAISVVIGHTHEIKSWLGIPAQEHFILLRFVLRGHDAVTLFFVLSGFLITYLLLAELQKTDTIHVRKFYARRLLRIWPLYFWLVFLGFVALPLFERAVGFDGYQSLNNVTLHQYISKLIAYIIFLPHLSALSGGFVTGISHLWSIGVEEYFYLMWPVLVKGFKRHLLTLLIGVIVFKIAAIVAFFLVSPNPLVANWFKELLGLVVYFRFENMAVGGLGAYLLFYKREAILPVIFHPVVEKATLVLMLGNIFVFTGDQGPHVNQFVSVVHILLILNVAANQRSTLKLENPVFNLLGQLSYGIYMYHVLVIYIVLAAFANTSFGQSDSFAFNIVLLILVVSITIGLAYISYQRLEKPFLRLKNRFTVVASGVPEPAPKPVTVLQEV
jgi:peptidoglycan/LPS O-acetylase OafA/YrhL